MADSSVASCTSVCLADSALTFLMRRIKAKTITAAARTEPLMMRTTHVDSWAGGANVSIVLGDVELLKPLSEAFPLIMFD